MAAAVSSVAPAAASVAPASSGPSSPAPANATASATVAAPAPGVQSNSLIHRLRTAFNKKKPKPKPATKKAATTTASSNTTASTSTAGATNTTAGPAVLSSGGPMDTQASDFGPSATIQNTPAFQSAVAAIIQKRHPNQVLVSNDVLSAIIQAVTLDVDVVSPQMMAPLLVSIINHVTAVKSLRAERAAELTLTLELFKAFPQVAYAAQNQSVPESLRCLTGTFLDTFLQAFIKPDGTHVEEKKLQLMINYQIQKLKIHQQSLAQSAATSTSTTTVAASS